MPLPTADQYTNFALSSISHGTTVGQPLFATDTSLTLPTGAGALFPSTTPFTIVIGGATVSPEICVCTARSGDTLTLSRGQEGTGAQAWAIASTVQLTVTAGGLSRLWSAVLGLATPTAGNISAGTFAAGVLLPVTQLTGSGALPSGATLPASQVSTGALPAGVTLDAGQLTGVLALHGLVSTTGGDLTVPGALALSGTAGVSLSGAGRTDPSSDTVAKLIKSATASTVDLVLASSGFRFVKNSGTTYTPVWTLDNTGAVHIMGNLTVDGTTTISGGVGTTTTQINVTGETLGQVLITAKPTGQATPSVYLVDDGTLTIKGLSNNVLSTFVSFVPSASVAATVSFPSGLQVTSGLSTDSLTATGTIAAALAQVTGASTGPLVQAIFSTAPGGDTGGVTLKVSGDTLSRANLAVLSTGYGALRLANGAGSYSGNQLQGTASGLLTDGGLSVTGTLKVGGTLGWTGTSGHVASTGTLEIAGSVAGPGGTTLGTVLAAGTTLGIGAYFYTFSYRSDDGETAPATFGLATITTTAGNQAVNLSNLAVGPTGTVSRALYRTKVGGSSAGPYYLVAVIADNTTTTYSDTVADASLGAQLVVRPTFGGALLIKSGGTAVAILASDGSAVLANGNWTVDSSGNAAAAALSLTSTSTSLTANGQLAFGPVVGSSYASLGNAAGVTQLTTVQSGSATGIALRVWTGSAVAVPFSVGGQFNSALSYVDATGVFKFAHTLSSANQLADWQQGYGLYSDNVGGTFAGSTTRLWIDAPNNGEFQVGGRAGTNRLAGVRLRSNTLLLDTVSGQLTFDYRSMSTSSNYLGFKAGGVKIAEFTSAGNMVISGGTYFTLSHPGVVSDATGTGAFDTFDVCEQYPCDLPYPAGTVVCLGDHGEMTRCMHLGCAYAHLISAGGALNIGGGGFSDGSAPDPTQRPIALVGRVRAQTQDVAIQPRDWLMSDGRGGVTRATPGAPCLGYALTPAARDGERGVVGVFVQARG